MRALALVLGWWFFFHSGFPTQLVGPFTTQEDCEKVVGAANIEGKRQNGNGTHAGYCWWDGKS